MKTQCERILELLEAAGDKGVDNHQLNEVAYRYSARLHDLKKQGYLIAARHIKDSHWRFTLLPQQAKLFEEEL